MSSFNLSLAFICIYYIITSSYINPAFGQPTDSTPQHFLDAHNAARANVSAGLSPMVWSSALENYALNYANTIRNNNACSSTTPSGNPPIHGENIWNSGAFLTGKVAVEKWVEEKGSYTYSTNTCATGKVCKHYTQVVWRNSVNLGCARVQCFNNGYYYVICSYDPAGNVAGQLPY